MSRENLFAQIRVAGYHHDRARFTQLIIENRIALGAAKSAFRVGQQARANGMKCNCSECRVIS